MTIFREINGKTVPIELSLEEMAAIHDQIQAESDVASVHVLFSTMCAEEGHTLPDQTARLIARETRSMSCDLTFGDTVRNYLIGYMEAKNIPCKPEMKEVPLCELL